MPEWLKSAGVAESPLPPGTIAMRLVLSLVFGVAVALIYRMSHGRESREVRTLATTLVLLSVLVAMVSMVIGESVARAFGLVGALSIVRFRTVVDDTRDTAFVIFAVIVGMATGTGLMLIAIIGIPIAGAAAIAMSSGTGGRARPGNVKTIGLTSSHSLVIRLGLGRDPATVLTGALDRHLSGHRLIGTATTRQGAALELTYIVELKSLDAQTHLVAELNQIEGVQNVDLRLAQ